MPATPFQPIIPEQPKQVSEAEFNFMEDSPPEFFPDNPESNFGLKRRLWTTQMQEIIDQLNLTYLERFPTSSTQFIDEWEITVGLPVGTDTSEAGIAARRNRVVSRLRKSAFTDELIRQVVEGYIAVTFGGPLMLTVPGVEIPVGGLTLYGEGGDISATYRVYHDLQNFSYTVYIRSDITPDIVGLTRELKRITPAGISFTIDNSKASVLDYQRTILDDGPSYYWPLNTTTGTGFPWQSIAGITNVLTPTGPPAAVAALVQNGGGVTADTQARDFNGSSHILTIPNGATMPYRMYSWEAWVRIDAFPASGNYGFIFDYDNAIPQQTYMGIYNNAGTTQWRFRSATRSSPLSVVEPVISTPLPQLATTYHVVGTWDGVVQRLYVNGVKINELSPSFETDTTVPANAYVGGTAFWNGVIDEPAIYGFILSDEQILRHYKTGINVA